MCNAVKISNARLDIALTLAIVLMDYLLRQFDIQCIYHWQRKKANPDTVINAPVHLTFNVVIQPKTIHQLNFNYKTCHPRSVPILLATPARTSCRQLCQKRRPLC